MSRLRKYVLSSAGGVAGLALLLAAVAWLLLRASLPRLDGALDVGGRLRASATIERDAAGIPSIIAADRLDLAYATGFAHGQDRFFQMDLQRRLAAGELAELLGPAMAREDRELRRHGFSRVAAEVLARSSEEERALLEAYSSGVNAALDSLAARPWEYLALRAVPRAWTPSDSLLVAFAMYLDLNDPEGEREIANAILASTLPPSVLPLLSPLGSEWDAPVDGGTWRLPSLPDPEAFDLRSDSVREATAGVTGDLPLTERIGDAAFGSNSWAVAGPLTATGGALLANDMHLGLAVPNIWYRARLVVQAEGQRSLDLAGVMLPGLPLLVAGSNGRVAWGFTNTHGDWTDLVIVDPDPADPGHYLTSSGPVPFTSRREVIRVRGAPDESVDITETVWGPVVGEDGSGRPLALAWTAHRPEATNLRMLALESAGDVEEALAIASESGAPVQNFVAADAAGRIGWTLFGRVPVREGYDSRLPASWTPAGTGWTRWRTPDEYPRIVDPLGGRLWTANTRTIDANLWLPFVGPGSYVLGARAGQIRDGLLSLREATAADMLSIQLDDRALFLARWRDLMLAVLADDHVADHPRRARARELVQEWTGRAAIDDAGYRIVRTFRRAVLTGTYGALVAPARAAHPDIDFEPGQQFETTAWQLVTGRPLHLLDPRYPSWESALLAWVDRALDELDAVCPALEACHWGLGNELEMRHPLSRALPLLSGFLDMPGQPLPGDSHMPRVQSPRQGASQRLVVSPGRESEGYFHMPGGQSAHPLSPFYRAGHEAWARGEAQPLLPGPARHTLHLRPD